MKEEYLLDGRLEPTNEWYAVAKIAGLKVCQAYRRQYGCDFISALPTNLYGPCDNFDPQTGHVVPALIAKMHAAKTAVAAEVEIWGTGKPRRELLHVDDLADACVHLLEIDSEEAVRGSSPWVNIGCGADLTIAELADKIRGVVRFEGRLRFAPERPDGTPQKLLDVSRLTALGWRPRIPLDQGLTDTYRWYLQHAAPDTPGSAATRTEEALQ